jgi:putative PIN family toxin of toxin-antitoxin system
MPERVVFDCMLFLQAVASDRGPAFRCFELVERGRIVLLLIPRILAEVGDVLSRPLLQSKLPGLTPKRANDFVSKFKSAAVLTPEPPSVFILPRDRNDQPYTDLAIAGHARYLVTWNERHLTYLMQKDTPEGIEFCQRFPELTILSPSAFIQLFA